MRVLVASDHPAVRAGLAHVLRREPGAVVETTSNAARALGAVGTFEPCVVLVDAPPGGAGPFVLCHALKQLARTPRVALFGNASSEAARAAAWVAGADALIDKSEAVDDLSDQLRTVCAGSRLLGRPRALDLNRLAGPLGATERSIMGMCVHGIPPHEISRTLRVDPLEVDAVISGLIGRLAGAPEARRHGISGNSQVFSAQS